MASETSQTVKSMYLCGPTLYDRIHIGNARSLVYFDALFRFYRSTDPEFRYARNITDVDDKILALCGDMAPWDWVAQNTRPQYRSDCLSLGLLPPTHEPLASDYIGEVRETAEIIGRSVDGSIVLDPSSVPNYGAASGRKPSGAFALWKAGTYAGLPAGKPGWHGECQAMIMYLFGPNGVDLHGGGTDLKFPHHENERAIHMQSCGKEIAREWAYVGTVNSDGRKMSKSIGNVETVSDLAKEWSTETLRTALLMTAPSKPIKWSFERLTEAEKIATAETAWLGEITDRHVSAMACNRTTRLPCRAEG